jgi:O-antigen/teichoic acid export membrane protein
MLANLAGRGWAMVLTFVFIPVYLRFLGVEAYALIGVFASLQGLANLLDLGLSQTINREMARASSDGQRARSARDLVRTLEIGYWAIGLLIAGIVFLLSPWIAYHWVQVRQLSRATVEQAVLIMGLVLAAQWPLSFYAGGLMGLQQQVAWSAVNALTATTRGLGAIVVLRFVSPTIQAFFIWQVFHSVFQTALAAGLLWRNLPAGEMPARIRWTLLRTVWRFAAGVSVTTLVSLLLGQVDKILLSRVLVLESFGYYVLASTLTVGLLMVPVAPITEALLPRMTQLLARGEVAAMTHLYHRGAQLVSVVVWPVAFVLVLFGQAVLQLWTRKFGLPSEARWIVSLLAVSTALQAMMAMPYNLQLAYGWTRLGAYQNAASLVVLVPTMLLLAGRYRAVGAAGAWLIVVVGHLAITPQVMFLRILNEEKWRWYRSDVACPMLAALVVAVVGRLLLSDRLAAAWLAGGMVLVLGAASLAAALASSQIRGVVLKKFASWLGRGSRAEIGR